MGDVHGVSVAAWLTNGPLMEETLRYIEETVAVRRPPVLE